MSINTFESRETASVAAAEFMQSALERRLDQQKRASLIVTGGSSPAKVYAELAHKDLAWDRVDVVLSDERWVDPAHEDSNERLVRDTFLVNGASAASLLPMYADGIELEQRVDDLNTELKLLPVPFSVALLGMGADGHFASLFPDASNLAEGLDADSTTFCLPVDTEASPYRRVSLSLSAIARSDAVAILAFGDDKRDVIKEALAGEGDYPVASLLRQKKAPVEIFWAP